MLAYSAVKGVPASVKTPPRILAYLSDRGIDVELACKLQLKILPAQELYASVRGADSPWHGLEETRHAIVFPHFDIRGDLLEWWSARLVQGDAPKPAKVHSFGSYIDPSKSGKPSKMTCPPNEPPHGYLPQGAGLPDWTNIPRGSRVYIHESVIKAVNGAVLGAYSVGLNGVFGWSSRKHDLALISELKEIPWRLQELTPVILFDTNLSTNQQVETAATRLAAKLFEVTGRTAKLLRLRREADDTQDFGFDDFVQRVGPDHARDFLNTPDEDLEDFDVSDVEMALRDLNEEFCVIERIAKVGRMVDATVYTKDAFVGVRCADKIVMVENADNVLKPVKVADLWIKDRRRTKVYDLTYAPGQPRLCEVRQVPYLNRWAGWGCDPTEEEPNVDPWLELMANNMRDPAMMEWLLNWFAYPVQFPGAKLASYPLIYGEQGTGKDQLFSPIRTIYGGNFVKIGAKALVSNFNSVYAEKQFVQADEIKSQHFTADDMNQVIKGIVTDETIVVNRKNQEEYVIPNTANLAITSNYVESVKLDEGDRRAGVIHWTWEGIPRSKNLKNNRPYWDAYTAWASPLHHNLGGPHVFAYLLQRDLTGFDPNGWAPTTIEKADVIEAGRTGTEAFVYHLKAEPELTLGPLCGARRLYSVRDLLTMYFGPRDFTEQAKPAMVKALKNAGFQQANGGKPVKFETGQERYWIIPRPDLPEIDFSVHANCVAHLKVFPGVKR